ncbi:MAG: cation:dicarboxylase symporter family transporter, partial [Gammaproteobacteria bacterium]
MPKLKLHWQIIIALVLAVFTGLLTGTDASLFGVTFFSIFEFVGTLFLNALKMLIVPLVASSIIIGIAGIGQQHGHLGRLGGKTILYYMTTSLIAILIGLVVVNIVSPGIIDGQPAKDLIGLGGDLDSIKEKVEG